MALATLTDLGVRLGQDLTGDDRAQALLDDISAELIAEIGDIFTSSEKTATLTPCCGVITLPTGPVTAVESVVDADDNPVTFSWTSGRKVTVFAYGDVTATYTSGYATVPGDIIAIVCQIAGRAFGTNPASGGVSQESLGEYSYSTGVIAAAGTLGRLPGEQAVIDRYKRKPLGMLATPPWIRARHVEVW